MSEHVAADDGLVPLERRVLRLWRIRAAIGTAAGMVLVAVGAGLAGGILFGLAVIVVGGIASTLLVRWWTGLVWRSWQFRIGHGALHLRHGVLVRHESTIPFHRVQHIDIEGGPLERRLGLRTFVLRTASASSDSAVPGIDAEDADRLRQQVLALAGTGDAL